PGRLPSFHAELLASAEEVDERPALRVVTQLRSLRRAKELLERRELSRPSVLFDQHAPVVSTGPRAQRLLLEAPVVVAETRVVVAGAFVVPRVRREIAESEVNELVESFVIQHEPRFIDVRGLGAGKDELLRLGIEPAADSRTGAAVLLELFLRLTEAKNRKLRLLFLLEILFVDRADRFDALLHVFDERRILDVIFDEV